MVTPAENPNKFKLVQVYLTSEAHLISYLLTKAENLIGVQKDIILNICVSLIVLALLFADPREQQFICSLVTIPFPAYRTWSSFHLESVNEFATCLLFWAFYVQFELIDPYLATLPFYFLAKTFFLLCLQLPPINLVNKWYVEWVKPLARLRQGKADREVISNASPKLLKNLKIDPEKVQTMNEAELKSKLIKVNVVNVLRQMLFLGPLEEK